MSVPLSMDCTMNLTVLDPMAEPMIREIYDEAEEAVLAKIKTYDGEHA
ncbi:MAG: hypothetical protein KAH99_04955 [Verrucomicrobia bacterium]|nr:hypothetical protein [Verrucomicrobiota bacterium]